MNALTHFRAYVMVCALIVLLQPLKALAQQNSNASKTSVQHAPSERDGQHDFDFELALGKLI